MRKVYATVTMRVIALVDDNIDEVNNAISENIHNWIPWGGDGTEINDFEVDNIEITDSK